MLKKMHCCGAMKMVRTFRFLNERRPCKKFYHVWYKHAREKTFMLNHQSIVSNKGNMKDRKVTKMTQQNKGNQIRDEIIKVIKKPCNMREIKLTKNELNNLINKTINDFANDNVEI